MSLTPLSLSSEQGLHPDGAPSGGGAGAAAVDGWDHLQGQVYCSSDQSDLPGECGRGIPALGSCSRVGELSLHQGWAAGAGQSRRRLWEHR